MELDGWRLEGLNKNNHFEMINIGKKTVLHRSAVASGRIYLRSETLSLIVKKKILKGDPLAVAEIAAIQAVKKTPDLIPMCHNIPIDSIKTSFTLTDSYVEIHCTVMATSKTGVEMEALTGVTVALLTIWDMVKYLEKDERGQYPSSKISEIKVDEKSKGEG